MELSPRGKRLDLLLNSLYLGTAIRKLRGGGGGAGKVEKNYSRKEKLNEKKFMHAN